MAGALAGCIATASPASAADRIEFDVPAGPLDNALIHFATQARVSVEVGDSALHPVRVHELRGRFTVREGLQRLLRGSGWDFAIGAGNVIRIFVRRQARVEKPGHVPVPTRPAPAKPPPPPPPAPSETIVVTATKQNAALADYPGSIHVATLEQAEAFRLGSRGSEVLLRELPNLTSTGLGSGRNKIFIRGLADSSFNGQTQATISQYLGESRLAYTAPDPDLALYDVASVEVIEGPQGALYGAGSLGGVIRVVPRAARIGQSELAGTGAIAATGGEIGGDGAIVGNLPLAGNAAIRLVGYAIRRPGYIDDIARGLSDINRTSVSGLRATVRWEPADRLALDFGVVGQNTASRDGQYTDSGTSALTRRSALAQPFDNDYRLAFVTARMDMGSVQLVSNTSYTNHNVDTTFDATMPGDPNPSVYLEDLRVRLLTHETRLTGSMAPFSSWVIGASLAWNRNFVDRSLGPPDDPPILSSGQSETFDGAVFGEASAAVWKTLSLTAGGRIALVRQIEEFKTPVTATELEPRHSQVHFLPTIALAWKPRNGWIVYARYQEGFRPGAQQLTGSGTEVAVNRFESDEIRTAEAGLRFGMHPGARLSGSLSFAYSRWDQIQADLVSPAGLPYVANLGSGYVRYVSASVTWKPVTDLALDVSGFLAASHLDRPAPEFAGAFEKDLPNIAAKGWRLSGRYEPWIGTAKLTFDGSIGYIGKSFLAIGAPFEFSQGDYLDTALGVRAEFGRWGLSLDLENLWNSRANRFSYGNPFTLAAGNQRTPLRPRTVRLGIDASF